MVQKKRKDRETNYGTQLHNAHKPASPLLIYIASNKDNNVTTEVVMFHYSVNILLNVFANANHNTRGLKKRDTKTVVLEWFSLAS